jgi:hypothetical protein
VRAGTRLALATAVRLSLIFVFTTGCLGAFGSGTTDGGITPDLAEPIDILHEFNTKVAPVLGGSDGKSGVCGACHGIPGGVGPAFLVARPDMLTTILSYPGLINTRPDNSRLYVKGAHEGPALTPGQSALLSDFIVVFNKVVPENPDAGIKPTVRPFVPVMGANTIDLANLDLNLTGARLTFNANMVGTALALTGLTLEAPPSTGVHAVHPLFVMWSTAGDPTPDPVDSFAGLDQTTAAATSDPLGPGTLLLNDFPTGASLSVVFETIEPKGGGVDGGTTVGGSGCKASAMFGTQVRPFLATQCYTCHSGGAGGYTMSASLSDDDQCAAARGEVSVTTPSSSHLWRYPNPAETGVHTGTGRKFDATTYAQYQAALSNWINAEK